MIRSLRLPALALLPLLLLVLTNFAAPSPEASPPIAPATVTASPTSRKAPNDTSTTFISLHYTDADPGVVLKDLFNQIGVPFETHPNTPEKWPHVTINADHQSYWQVVATLNDALQTTFNVRRNGKVSVNRDAGPHHPEAGVRCISGPCLLIANGVHHNMRLTDAERQRDCAVDIMFLVEPHIRVATFDMRCQPDVALDENGKSLLCDPAPPPAAKAPSPDTYMQPQIVLDPPADAGRRIAQLKGSYHFTVVDQALVIEIAAADFAKPTTADLDGAKITVYPLRPFSQQYSVAFQVAKEAQTLDQWERTNELLDAATIALLDDHDFPLFSAGNGGGKGTKDRSISASFRQDESFTQFRAGPPAKCRITIPRTLRDVAIPFEFKNLPLP